MTIFIISAVILSTLIGISIGIKVIENAHKAIEIGDKLDILAEAFNEMTSKLTDGISIGIDTQNDDEGDGYVN